MSQLPIADYALLSDCRSAALVSRAGSIDWLCFPRFDSPSIFGRILDDSAGHWSVRPRAETGGEVRRRYLEGSLVLETTFTTPSGVAVLTDTLALGLHERGHELGAHAPVAVLRRVVAVDGTVEMTCDFAPRPGYALVHPMVRLFADGVVATTEEHGLTLSAAVPLEVVGATATATFTLRAGQSTSFALQYTPGPDGQPWAWTQEEIDERIDDNLEAWRTWSHMHQTYDGPWADLVHLSGRVLYGLTYYPTGAMVAAPTTSLPELPGGARNWDYRYAWVRDASFTLQALWVAACPHEADKFFDYLARAAESGRDDGELQIMFGIGGEHELIEHELPHLSGWRNSAPVRVGNGAWNQRQLDVYGELLDAAYRLPDQVDVLSPATRRFLAGLADTAAARWQERDHGIWEMRDEPRDYVYSKLMCWVALDRAISMAAQLKATDRVEHWTATRTEIADAIMTRGWNDEVGAFTQAFGSDELDASNLMMPIVGFLPADHARVGATIDATVAQLCDERGLVYRYRNSDGLAGDEGTFLLCTFWLAQAQALAGRGDAARATFEIAATYANDVGLLAEEVDPDSGELLGNFPQAFSHIGLVNAAWAISQMHP